MRMKNLQEQRVALISQMDALVNVEVREGEEAPVLDTKAFEDLKVKVEKIDAEVKALKELNKIKDEPKKTVQEGEKDMEIREQLLTGQEVEMRSNEVSTATIGAGIPTDYVDGVVKKAEVISPLFGMADKMVTSANTAITVQGEKLGKFVPMNELQAYANKAITMEEKVLNAHKFGILSTVSQELLDDASFDVEAEISGQITEGFAMTMDELLIAGTDKIFGIEKATVANGAKEITVAAKLTVDNLLDIYYALNPAYRANAVWVINQETERELAGLVDGQGRPMLVAGYGATPTFTVLGRPVIVNPNATKVSFVDMKKAVKVGIRKNLVVKRDDSIGFANDTVAFKGTCRVDIVDMVQEAIVYGKVAAKTK